MANGNTVLVVDDNDQNLYLIEVLLKSQNFHVTTAKDGKQALEKARKDIPFMIISDILMPVMDGFTLCRAWKQDDLLKEVPFVFYTATYTDQKDEEYALSLGADKFIRKPMEPDLFLEQIQTVLKESLEKSLPTHEPLVKDEDEDYKLYSERLVNKLEKKMFQLEEEIETRKKVEIELRDSKKEWKDIFQAIGNPAFIIDNEYNILNANLAAINASKVSENELKKMKCYEIFHGLDKPVHNCPMCNLINTNQKQTGEIEIENFGGSYLISCTPIFDGKNKLEKAIHIATDITALKKAEKSLRDSEKKFKSVFHNAHIGIVIANNEGELEDFNEDFRKLLGYGRAELLGMNFGNFTFPDDLENELEYFNKIKDGLLSTYRLQKRYVTKNKDIKWIELTVSAVRGNDGEIIQFIGMVLDIDEQKKSEENKKQLEMQLRQSQKIEAIGNLAGGIAHDFNNILSTIIGYTELSFDDVEKGSILEDNLNEIYNGGKRARDLVQQILTFARKADEDIIRIRPDQMAKEVVKLLKSTTPSSIEIRTHFNTSSYIMGNSIQLHQVFMNLCTNSIQSMEDAGGILELNIKDKVFPSLTEDTIGVQGGESILIKVSDTGTGIPKNVLDSIFDPYFTTKELGQGTGLGLSTVHGIIKSYGGEITVKSQENIGTTFKIYLPIVSNNGQTQSHKDVSIPKGTEKILFVDDESSIVDVGKKILTRLGYKVTAMTSSFEALDRFRSNPDAFDLVITDMTMPNLSGDRLSSELIKIRSDIPIILLTGFSKKIDKDKAVQMGIKAFAHKPLVLSKLAKIIRKVLNS
ncbi:MAG: response regulator [Desulfobacula sp.]|jgi:two-component system, cell cycle sensor histidine kinase and response regulator CckA|nr:response regulator [Desulfobacula sp.]MBT6338364.1 response regulator [Desulfobacula sp.]MBT7261621.1 response regulator [Desulfobacula sp.]